MQNALLTKNRTAGGAITARRFVTEGAADLVAVMASANTNPIIGISDEAHDVAINERVDIHHVGIAALELGGTVVRGQYLTADSQGRGIAVTGPLMQTGRVRIGAKALVSGVSGDHIQVLVLPQESAGIPVNVGFTIGDEATNAITVNCQFNDADGVALAVAAALPYYLADDAAGMTPTTSAPDGGVAAGTDGSIVPITANLSGYGVSEADGDLDLVITHAAGAKTVYLVFILPNGMLAISDAITFA